MFPVCVNSDVVLHIFISVFDFQIIVCFIVYFVPYFSCSLGLDYWILLFKITPNIAVKSYRYFLAINSYIFFPTEENLALKKSQFQQKYCIGTDHKFYVSDLTYWQGVFQLKVFIVIGHTFSIDSPKIY